MRSRGAISDCPRAPRPPQDSFLSSAPDAAVVSKSDARHFAGDFAADSEPSRGTEGRKRVKTHPKDQSGPVPERRFLEESELDPQAEIAAAVRRGWVELGVM